MKQSDKKRIGRQIEMAIDQEEFGRAIEIINDALGGSSEWEAHWLYARLAHAWCRQGNLVEATLWVKKGLSIAPRCPLLLWELGLIYEMENEYASAVNVYSQIIELGENELAEGDCGEGRSWANSMMADSYFRMGYCLFELGFREKAIESIIARLSKSELGIDYEYSDDEVREFLDRLRGN
jgi:tetratricopeptide (TPR) repeat protein